MQAHLLNATDLAGFRNEARELLARRVPPDEVSWPAPRPIDAVVAPALPPAATRPRHAARAASAIVPASFVRLSEFVVLHRDPERFALLYRLLWRLVHEPGLRYETTDADMQRAQHMGHAVRRDVHKMKTHVQFVDVPNAGESEPQHIAWYEPAHNIVEAVVPAFTKRMPTQRFAILTPTHSAWYDGTQLSYGPGPQAHPRASAGAMELLACWRGVFAPRREAA